MVYVGGALPTQRYGETENCLIDPTLPISRQGSDKPGRTMPYWPSYSGIQPAARRAYLEWLAGGRCDPDVGIGHVFLFFYGLERRLFIDKAIGEIGSITAEVERLLAIHGENSSFRTYARTLWDAAALLKGDAGALPDLSPDLRSGYEMPFAVRLHLGRRLANKAPLDADDALLWVLSLPDTVLRTAATRCFEELKALWRIRFAERYPDGLKVRAPKTGLRAEYRAASGTFQTPLTVTDGHIPDIAAVSAPLDGLRDLVNACTDELDPYSRLLGRRPEARGTAEAAALLPRAVLDTAGDSPARAVRARLDAAFGGHPTAAITVRHLLEWLGMVVPQSGRIPAAMASQIGAFLDKLDVGFEPDRRYGPSVLNPDGRVLLFRASNGAPVDADRIEYEAARTMIEVSALAAAADGEIADAELDAVRADLEAIDGLTATERTRLLAHAVVLLKDAPRHQAVMKRLSSLPERQRRRVSQAALSAVLADGHASPGEVKFLERLYKTLGLPQEDVYASLHRGEVTVDEPVRIAAEERAPGIPIPPPPSRPSGVQIDQARLSRIQRETSAVSSLLADIFIEDEPAAAAAPAAASKPSVGVYDGLDPAHGELLSWVLSGGEVTWEEFEEKARRLRLLPDGAFETINEWGFETLDEAVLDGDQTIFVAEHLRAELERREAAE